MTVLLTDFFGTRWVLENPQVLRGMWGSVFLRARYHQEGELLDYDLGDFRLDTAQAWEVR